MANTDKILAILYESQRKGFSLQNLNYNFYADYFKQAKQLELL